MNFISDQRKPFGHMSPESRDHLPEFTRRLNSCILHNSQNLSTALVLSNNFLPVRSLGFLVGCLLVERGPKVGSGVKSPGAVPLSLGHRVVAGRGCSRMSPEGPAADAFIGLANKMADGGGSGVANPRRGPGMRASNMVAEWILFFM